MRRPLLCGCICLFVIVALWTKLMHPLPRSNENADREGDYVTLVGQVYQKEYRISYGEEKVLLYLDSISNFQGTDVPLIPTENNYERLICEISLSELGELKAMPPLGCHMVVEGVMEPFLHATNEGEFDAADYYAMEGVAGKVKEARIIKMDNRCWPIREALYKLRQHWLRNLYMAFPEREAALLAKMLLGDGSGLDKEIRDLYQSNGIVHILSISGLHITLLGMGLYQGLRHLTIPIIPAAFVGGVAILLYGLMTGFGVSACRAVGMYLIHMLGEIWGRTYDMLTAMGVLAVIMLLDNPLLSYHSGYLLSFSSVCGVGLLAPTLVPTEQNFMRKPWDGKVKILLKSIWGRTVSGLASSCSVTLFTLPIQFFFFYKIPVYSVLINLFVIPFMSVVMSVGIVVMILPMLFFLSPIEVGIFNWFEWLCKMFEKLPGHTFLLGRPDMWKILIYYALLLIALYCHRKHRVLGRFCMVFGVLLLIIRMPEGTKVYCLDVGQGDCMIVKTSDNECFMFDGGSSSRQNVGEKVILPFLQYHGIRKLDGVFLSHGDVDHINGILQLLEKEKIEVEAVYLPDVPEEGMADLVERLKKIKDLQVQMIQKGDKWMGGEFVLTCLHPVKGYIGESNETSACYLFQIKDFSMLLTGDVEGKGERYLVEELQRYSISEVDMLKVPHHGSANGTSGELLAQINPKISVISCGRNNPYGHPHKETLDRLNKAGSLIMSTTEYGRIMVNVEKSRVEGYLKAED